ncbi:MAG: Type 1 glutamine amidotransferase-like domain-containing protein [candidate division WOR-3 bacterium]
MRYSKLILGVFLLSILPDKTYSRGYIVALGGGTEGIGSSSYYPGTWSDSAFKWALSKVGYNKDFVAVYYDNYDASWWVSYLRGLGHTGTVKSIRVTMQNANNPSKWVDVYNPNTGIIWFPGGDQSSYIPILKNTALGDSIRARYLRGEVCVGGTSAGAMILGEYVSTGSSYSDEAIRNPYNSFLSYDVNVLPLIDNFLFDTHVAEKGRIGRMFAHLGRIKNDYGEDITIAGIDDCTALCIDSDLSATVIGSGSVTFLRATPSTERIVQSGRPLVLTNLKTVRAGDRFKVDLQTLSVLSIPATAWEITQAPPSVTPPPGPIILVGGKPNERVDQQSALQEFLSLAGSSPIVTIFTANTTMDTVINYRNSLLSLGASQVYLVEISSTGVNNQTYAEYVSNSSGFVFLKNNLQVTGDLLLASNPVGNAYRQKVSQGVPQIFIGLDCWLVNEKVIYNTESNTYNAYYGDLRTSNGLNLIPGFFVSPAVFVWESASPGYQYLESKIDGLFWLLTYYPGSVGLLLDGASNIMSNDETWVKITPDGMLKSRRGTNGSPVIILDLNQNQCATRSTWTMRSTSSGPRQNGSIAPFVIHVVDSNFVYDLVQRLDVREKGSDKNMIGLNYLSNGCVKIYLQESGGELRVFDPRGIFYGSARFEGREYTMKLPDKRGIYFVEVRQKDHRKVFRVVRF